MRLYNNLPLTPYFYCAETIYYWYQKIIYQAIETDIQGGYIYFSEPQELTKTKKQQWRDAEKIDRKTFDKLYHCNIDNIPNQDFIVALPFFTWEKVAAELRKVPAGPRKRIARVFLYIYYWAMRFQGSYSRPREMMVKELHINKDNLADAITWLEEKGFVVRTDYSKQEGYARRYYIPDKFWNNQCKKEWQNLQKSLAGSSN